MNWDEYRNQLENSAEFLRKYSNQPRWCIILGSGLGGFDSHCDTIFKSISYHDIPGFPKPTISGHKGLLHFCSVGKTDCILMEGRFHLYEGHSPSDVVFPIRAMLLMGIKYFFITNAAGGISSSLSVGDLMLIEDHINLMGTNPLIGPNLDLLGPRFPAMRDCYDPELRQLVVTKAINNGIDLKTGVYVALSGPAYETQAEINMLKVIGADAVGMSTVPEVIAIRHGGANVVGISLITNMTNSPEPPTHEEVLETGEKRRKELHQLIYSVIRETK